MIVSIRHSILKDLFEKGAAAGLTGPRKQQLLLWLSVFHAAKDLTDVSVPGVSMLHQNEDRCRLHVPGLGTFSFRFVNGEIRSLNFKNDQK